MAEPDRVTAPIAVHSAAAAPAGVVDLIGNTSLLDLTALVPEPAAGVRLYAKAEHTNPGGSVKDRPALAMVLDAERRGLLDGRRRILDATSGNTGIAYAMIGAARGHGVTLCLPANASPERKRILAAYGAELVITDPLEGTDGAILEARRLAAAEPDRFVYLDQYSNPENPAAHERSTGPEIVAQTGGAVTHFVTGLGTSGTFIGVGRFLRRAVPGVTLISVEPDGPLHGLEGMKHMASALVPAIYDPELADERWAIATEEAYRTVKLLAREAGLLVGVSAGANVAAALRLADRLAGREAVIVTVLCDGADKYLSAAFWDEGEAAGERLEVPAAALAAAAAHAETAYPEECCGFLLGRPLAAGAAGAGGRAAAGNAGAGSGAAVARAVAADNERDAERRRRYTIGPEAVLRADRAARAEGLEIVGYYHSHPDHPAQPSTFDREHAWPGVSYLIVPVAAGRAGTPRCWRLADDRGGFVEQAMAVFGEPEENPR